MLSHLLALHRRNPYLGYWLLRHTRPTLRVGRSLWLVSRYDEVKRVCNDHATFSSETHRSPGPAREASGASANMATSDPPRHTRLRALVTHGFTSQSVARLEPRIAELTHELIDAKLATGGMDLVQDLAAPLPVIVIAEILGVPSEDRARFKLWSEGIVASGERLIAGQETPPTSHAREMTLYLGGMIARRRAAPRDD
jgi:cytochrome P450